MELARQHSRFDFVTPERETITTRTNRVAVGDPKGNARSSSTLVNRQLSTSPAGRVWAQGSLFG